MKIKPYENLTLSENQLKVLKSLIGDPEYDQEGVCYGFKGIMHDTGLDRRNVRLACRALARKGLATYEKGLMNDEGGLAGSGYGATPLGRDVIYRMEEYERVMEEAKQFAGPPPVNGTLL